MANELLDIWEDAGPATQGRPVPAALSEMAVVDYALVIKPTPLIWDQLVALKQQIAEWCHCPEAAQTKPYLTLLRFAQVAPAEDTLVRRLSLLTQGMMPLRIVLGNYSGIPKHTLQVQAVEDALLSDFLLQLKRLSPLLTLHKKQRPQLCRPPAICLARQLQPGAYEEGLARLEPLEYSNVFMARECLLMAKSRGAKGFRLLHTLSFQGQPAKEQVEQARLW